VLGNNIRQCLQGKQETRSFAIYVIRRQSGWIAGDLYEMDLRHFADEKQLAAHLDILRQSRPETYAAAPAGEFIARLNEPFLAQARSPQPGMLRVAPKAARVMLARSEGPVYRLGRGGPAPLSAIDAVKGDLWRSGEFAIWRHDAAALEKWASRSATETLRQFERSEQNKNHGMEV
ncbi:MAG: hypothetical protein LBL37_08535, partial [Gracilibacteraceae bacterium]|nr:hypothetical protein [Gracilibacteraceae bacterium]